MTIQALRGKVGRSIRVGKPAGPPAPEPLAIGETDKEIFNCPVCARPLALGAGLCPGCGTRLLVGVPARRASIFIAIGLIVGMMVGGSAMAVIASIESTGPARAVAPAVTAPSAAPGASAPAPAPAVDVSVPSAAISALRQTALLNDRIVADANLLEIALRAGPSGTPDVARALRSLAADAALGTPMAKGVAAWAAGADVSADLSSFYRKIGATAKDGLSYSLANDRAYARAARDMLRVIDGMAALDATSRSLAAGAAFELPPVSLPGS